MATFNKCHKFVQDLGQKVHNLDTDTLAFALTNTAPTSATTTYTGLPGEVASGGGYTAGGLAVAGSVTFTHIGGLASLKSTANTVFTATTGFGPFRYVLLYNQTSAGKEAIGWYDYGTSISLGAGETLTIDVLTNTSILTIQ